MSLYSHLSFICSFITHKYRWSPYYDKIIVVRCRSSWWGYTHIEAYNTARWDPWRGGEQEWGGMRRPNIALGGSEAPAGTDLKEV